MCPVKAKLLCLTLAILFLSAFLLVSGGPAGAKDDAPPKDQAAQNGQSADKALFEKRCSKCHGLDKVTAKKETPEAWNATVQKMAAKWFSGISAEEAKAIAAYLAKTQGK
jgi:mono/diheme cytochrome c family protein